MKIYLVSTDGYMESVIGGKCAKDEEGVRQIVEDYQSEFFLGRVRNVQVDLHSGTVTFEEGWDRDGEVDSWKEYTFELISFDVIGGWEKLFTEDGQEMFIKVRDNGGLIDEVL